jgi:IS5 family transposase
MWCFRPGNAEITHKTGRSDVALGGRIMRAKPKKQPQGTFLYPDLLDQLDPKHPLLQLAARIPWKRFEAEFSALYSDQGRPAKPTRLMVGLMLLKL